MRCGQDERRAFRRSPSFLLALTLIATIPFVGALAVGYSVTRTLLAPETTTPAAYAGRDPDLCAAVPRLCDQNRSAPAPSHTGQAAASRYARQDRLPPRSEALVAYRVTGHTATTFDATLTLTNTSASEWPEWTLELRLPNTSIVRIRGLTPSLQEQGSAVRLHGSVRVPAGARTTFTVTALGAPTVPSDCALDGRPCSFTLG